MIQEDLKRRNIDPGKFGDRINFMSMFNDIDGNKKNNGGECVSNSEEVRNYAKRFSQGHWTFPWTWKWRTVVWFLFIKARREMELRSSRNATTIRGNKDTQILQVLVLWVVGSWKESKTKTPLTSQQNLWMWNSYSESFTLRISSVFREQCQTGVDSPVLEGWANFGNIRRKRRIRKRCGPNNPRWTNRQQHFLNVSAESQTATTGCPVSPSTGKPVARIYEPQRETHSETIPDLNIVRTLPTANRFVHEISWSSRRRKHFGVAVRKNSLRCRHSRIGQRASGQKCLLDPDTIRKPCGGLRSRDGYFGRRSQDDAVVFWIFLKVAEAWKIWPILSRKTEGMYDPQILPGDGHSWDYSWFLWSIQHNFEWRRCPRIWYSLGWSVIFNPRCTCGQCSGKPMQDANTVVWSTPNCLGFLRTRHSTKRRTAKLPEMEKHGKEFLRINRRGLEILRPETKEPWQEHWRKAKVN